MPATDKHTRESEALRKYRVEKKYRDAAIANLHVDGELEIDHDAQVGLSDDGAFVQAWVWVGNESLEPTTGETA